MLKSTALLLSILFVFVVFSQVTLFNTYDPDVEREEVTISRVIDGDTVELEDGRILRLVNINSPEKNTQWSAKATEFLKQYQNSTVQIEAIDTDRYGRTLARIYDSTYINHELVRLGLASKFLVQPTELKLFANAEKEAIEKGIGIWVHSEYYPCFTLNVDAREEFVLIDNACDNISLEGFVMKDESRKLYEFSDITYQRVILYTTNGSDAGNELFWDSSAAIWNNDRDAAYLFDNEGKLAGYYSYGY